MNACVAARTPAFCHDAIPGSSVTGASDSRRVGEDIGLKSVLPPGQLSAPNEKGIDL